MIFQYECTRKPYGSDRVEYISFLFTLIRAYTGIKLCLLLQVKEVDLGCCGAAAGENILNYER
jgi:hypothetical protein